jgi:hypothetical protein
MGLDGLEVRYEESRELLQGLKQAMRGELTPKVRLTLNSTIIPLEKVKPETKNTVVLEVSLTSSYESVRTTHLLNTIKLFQS